MQGIFNLPSIDHLREGVDYTIVEWDFATSAPTPAPAPAHTPGESCDPGEKMVFGVCRKLRAGSAADKDFDQEQKSKQETALDEAAKAQGAKVNTKEEAASANAKGFTSGGKKYGWAIKNGKPVIVEWGSVAGTKKQATPAPGTATAASPAPAPATAPAPASAAAAPAAGAPPKPKTPTTVFT